MLRRANIDTSMPGGTANDTRVPSTKLFATQLATKGTYSKPSGGIPKTDLASAVQTSLGLADSALQSHLTAGTGVSISSNAISVNYGTTSTTACAGDDSRLSNARTPTSHAVNANTYGLGTTGVYGHCKTINGLTQSSHADGLALSAYQLYHSRPNRFDIGNCYNNDDALHKVLESFIREKSGSGSRIYSESGELL